MTEHGINRVAVIGGGQMGGGIAQVAAVAGFDTVVCDPAPGAIDRCRATHQKLIARAVEKGRMQQPEADAALGRIAYADDLDAAIGDRPPQIVIEAVVEDAAVKKEVFGALDDRVPSSGDPSSAAILATNTSSISITEIAAATSSPDRVVGMHFFYPVPVMGLVEVISGLATDPSVTERVVALSEAMGKTPLRANDRPGFVSNRVLMPMINEAFYALMEGVAEPEAIDGIMKLGCNFPMGPLRLADFIGLDTCAHIMNVLAEGLNGERYRPCPLLRQYVAAGRLGNKSGRGVYDYAE